MPTAIQRVPWGRHFYTTEGFVALPVGSRIHVCESAGQVCALSKPVPVFRTTNGSSYSRFLKRRGSLMVWFDAETAWFAAPSGKAGHPERFSAAAIQFCLSIKVLFGLPHRQIEPWERHWPGRPWRGEAWRAFWACRSPTDPCRITQCSAAGRSTDRCRSRIARHAGRCTCWWTAPVSGSRAKANGRSASTGPAAVASGARSISILTLTLLRCGLWR